MASFLQDSSTHTNLFYYNNYQTIMTVLITIILLLFTMGLILLYQVSHRPLPEFIAIANNANTMKLQSYDEPNLLPSTLLRWANKAAVAAYTFDFANYNQQIAEVRPYFTNNGWDNYQSSVYQLIQDITKKQLFVNSVVSGTSIITNQGDYSSLGYIWRTQVPFLVTYQTAEAHSQSRFLILITIAKVPTNQNPTGIGIDQFSMQKG